MQTDQFHSRHILLLLPLLITMRTVSLIDKSLLLHNPAPLACLWPGVMEPRGSLVPCLWPGVYPVALHFPRDTQGQGPHSIPQHGHQPPSTMGDHKMNGGVQAKIMKRCPFCFVVYVHDNVGDNGNWERKLKWTFKPTGYLHIDRFYTSVTFPKIPRKIWKPGTSQVSLKWKNLSKISLDTWKGSKDM